MTLKKLEQFNENELRELVMALIDEIPEDEERDYTWALNATYSELTDFVLSNPGYFIAGKNDT